jgi:hypothetical protein
MSFFFWRYILRLILCAITRSKQKKNMSHSASQKTDVKMNLKTREVINGVENAFKNQQQLLTPVTQLLP